MKKLLFVVVLIMLICSYSSIVIGATREEIRTQVRDFLGEYTANRFSDSQIFNWIDEAQKRFVTFTVNDALYTMTADSKIYSANGSNKEFDFPSDFMRLIGTTIDTGITTYAAYLMSMRRIWELHRSHTYRPTAKNPYTYVASAHIFIDPAPESGETITIWYIKRPVALATDDSSPQIPEEFHYLLIRYAVGQALKKDKQYDRSRAFITEFENSIQAINTRYLNYMKLEADEKGNITPRVPIGGSR